MASKLKIKVNGLTHGVTASLDTPLLYVLHNELHLHGPRFGCGLAQCGACSVLLDGKEIRSCVTPVAAVSGKSDHDARGPAGAVGEVAWHDGGGAGCAASAAAGVDRRAGAALRLLPERDDDPGRRPAGDDEEPVRGSDPHGDERASLPLRHLSADPDRDPEGRGRDGEGWGVAMTEMLEQGVLAQVVRQGRRRADRRLQRSRGVGLAGKAAAAAAPTSAGYLPDVNQVDSWITIDADNTVTLISRPDRDRATASRPASCRSLAEELDMDMSQIRSRSTRADSRTRRRELGRRRAAANAIARAPARRSARRRATRARRCSASPRRSSACRSRA